MQQGLRYSRAREIKKQGRWMTTNGNKGYYFEDLAVGMEASYEEDHQ